MSKRISIKIELSPEDIASKYYLLAGRWNSELDIKFTKPFWITRLQNTKFADKSQFEPNKNFADDVISEINPDM